MRIVYMGTPEFAVLPLKKIIAAGFNVVAVVTAPDKPAGRGQKIQTSPVKDMAVSLGIPVLQPTNLKAEEFIQELKTFSADLQIVVAFRMLPEVVWNMPPLGTYNLHASLLPQYRGAAPINWAIINGEKKSGVTVFKLQHEIDTGSILLQRSVDIGMDTTAGELYSKLMEIGSDLLVEAIQLISSGKFVLRRQEELLNDTIELKHAPKIFKEDCKIDWRKKNTEIYNLIRGLSPYPAAWTTLILNGKEEILKLYKATLLNTESALSPGTLEVSGKDKLVVSCGTGKIVLDEIQLAGRKRMPVAEFLKGIKLSPTDMLK